MAAVSPAQTRPLNARQAARAASTGLALALFLFLFAVYLLTYTPRINSSDGLAMFSTAESLVRRGALDVEQIRWMELQQGTYGLDGRLYSRKGIGLPLGLLPLAWLGLVVPGWGPLGTSLLFNPLVTALTAVLLLVYLQRLGFSRRTSLGVALVFGLLTPAWPYAKSLFSDPLSGLLLLAAAYLLLRFHQTIAYGGPGPAQAAESRASSATALLYPLLAGLCLGWNVAARYAEAIFVPLFGLLLLSYLRSAAGDRRPGRQGYLPAILALAAFALPIVLIGLGLIAFNLSRYGDPFNTGYLPNETFSGNLWQGVIGQLFSPGRGLFLYSPILILSLAGIVPFFRRGRPETLVALSVILIHLLLYGQWFMWHGGYAWGPRFLVPTLPFWALFLAPVLEAAFPWQSDRSLPSASGRPASILRPILLALAALSLIPQFLGVVVDFAPFQNSLLDTGLPLFAPETFFEPRYSPLWRTWAFITPANLDLAWAWGGQVNRLLLAVLLGNVILSGGSFAAGRSNILKLGEDLSNNRAAWRLIPALLLNLIAAGLLLAHVHRLPAAPLRQAVDALNEGVRPADAVIRNDPEESMPFAELYRGRAPVLGLNGGGFPLPEDVTRRLAGMIAAHDQVWWLPNWLPPEESAIEQTLLAACYRARNEDFGGRRLSLFACPQQLGEQSQPGGQTFAGAIRLATIAYPPVSSPGVALPLELRWQCLAPVAGDYHVFIHLLNDEGQKVAQADGQPVHWTRPTSTWRPGETITDRQGLWLPPGLAPGRYQLRLGFYRPADGQRLQLEDGADAVTFTLTVK